MALPATQYGVLAIFKGLLNSSSSTQCKSRRPKLRPTGLAEIGEHLATDPGLRRNQRRRDSGSPLLFEALEADMSRARSMDGFSVLGRMACSVANAISVSMMLSL